VTKSDDDKAAVENMSRLAHDIRFAHKSMDQSTQAKNVLKSVLGLALKPPRLPRDPYFPKEQKTQTIASTNAGGGGGASDIGSGARSSNSERSKSRGEPASGDRAIRSALASEVIPNATQGQDETSRDSVVLTGCEILLLTVVCSQGLPVWSPNWLQLILENAVPEGQGHDSEHVISWHCMAKVFQTAANSWHENAKKKLDEKIAKLDQSKRSSGGQEATNISKKLDALKLDVERRSDCLAIARDFNKDPMKLTKKVIMLLEKLRSVMGAAESKNGTGRARAKKSGINDGLGQHVLRWMGTEIGKWAENLGVVDMAGCGLDLTAEDSQEASDKSFPQAMGMLDSVDCLSVFGQIAQQTRLRSIFLTHTQGEAVKLVKKARHKCKKDEDDWPGQPSWWKVKEDFELLESLLEYGYSKIGPVLRDMAPELNEVRKLCGRHCLVRFPLFLFCRIQIKKTVAPLMYFCRIWLFNIVQTN